MGADGVGWEMPGKPGENGALLAEG